MPRIINRLYVARRPINIGYAKYSLVPVCLILRIREILQHTETFAERNLLLDRELLTAKTSRRCSRNAADTASNTSFSSGRERSTPDTSAPMPSAWGKTETCDACATVFIRYGPPVVILPADYLATLYWATQGAIVT